MRNWDGVSKLGSSRPSSRQRESYYKNNSNSNSSTTIAASAAASERSIVDKENSGPELLLTPVVTELYLPARQSSNNSIHSSSNYNNSKRDDSSSGRRKSSRRHSSCRVSPTHMTTMMVQSGSSTTTMMAQQQQQQQYSIPVDDILVVNTSAQGGTRLHITTLSLGCFEFDCSTANGHDILLAFLQASLLPERILCDYFSNNSNCENKNSNIRSGSSVTSSSQCLDIDTLQAKCIEGGAEAETWPEKLSRRVGHVFSNLSEMSGPFCDAMMCCTTSNNDDSTRCCAASADDASTAAAAADNRSATASAGANHANTHKGAETREAPPERNYRFISSVAEQQ